jgi:hypothetical protein
VAGGCKSVCLSDSRRGSYVHSWSTFHSEGNNWIKPVDRSVSRGELRKYDRRRFVTSFFLVFQRDQVFEGQIQGQMAQNVVEGQMVTKLVGICPWEGQMDFVCPCRFRFVATICPSQGQMPTNSPFAPQIGQKSSLFTSICPCRFRFMPSICPSVQGQMLFEGQMLFPANHVPAFRGKC